MPRFRVARPAHAIWNVAKTVAAIALFDAVVVWAIPTLVLYLYQTDADIGLSFPPQVAAGAVVLAVSSALVLWAGITLAIEGQGTPLPFDAPRRLVIGGPYAWFRTPMVSGTLGQVTGVAVMTGSVFVLLLVPVLALLWNTLVRTSDDVTLQHLFGRRYELYRRSVRCWLPRRAAWRPPPEVGPFATATLPDRPRRRRAG